MKVKLFKRIIALRKSDLVRNSFWGLSANGAQSLLTSLFYVVLARKYATTEFSYFMIASSIYQFLAAISNLGLGQWFTREIVSAPENGGVINKFLKLQLYSGFLFYGINVFLAFVLYNSYEIRILVIVLGINIVFDNLIYVIKALNVARLEQNMTFKIIILDSVLKFLMVFLLIFYPLSIVTLSVGLICIRFITLNLFLQYGSRKIISLRLLWSYKITLKEMSSIALLNWPFLVIGSVSIVYWRIGNIIISKVLSLLDVAIYEISFRVFSVSQILPIIISASLYPHFIKLYNTGEKIKFNALYKKYFYLFLLYGLGMYTFIYSFADQIMPFIFGQKYAAAPVYTKQMFLTIVLFPTAMLQATVLTSIKLERLDMILNVISLVVSVLAIMIGLSFSRSLAVINYSIFVSFFVFHICQNGILIKRKITTIKNVVSLYVLMAAFVLGYILLASKFSATALFIEIWGVAAIVAIAVRWKKNSRTRIAILHGNN
ncbi:MAG TPA: oligosaccharide flippase family protein [Puia sp.]|jgi:O-antigen/teichoic acid export membrane protein|nr:oligosaccharide flippase family protein [Puia sp.]